MKKLWLVGVGALVMAVTAVYAGEKGKDKPAEQADKEMAAVAGTEMTVTGIVEKMERKKKDGTPFMTWFQLTGEDGVITHLPKGKVEDYVGMKVTITGTGEETRKRNKTARKLETITSIEKVAGEAPPAK
jgi:hypothetical protein